MGDDTIAKRFLELAASEMDSVRSVIPSDPTEKVALLVEVLRALDYLTIAEPLLPEDRQLGKCDFQMIHWGWNVIAGLLLAPVSQHGALPLFRANEDIQRFSVTLLHQAGRASLLKRTSDMVRYGLLAAESTAESLVVRRVSPALDLQFADHLEPARLEVLNQLLNDTKCDTAHGWTLVSRDAAEEIGEEPGAFLGRDQESPLASWKSEDVDSLMTSLIFPWDSGHGMMMGYRAHPDVDNHFLVDGIDFISQCRAEIGLHPEVVFGRTTGSDVTAIAAVVAGLHLKHIRFALLSQKSNTDIQLNKSLTIWGPRSELVDSIADFSGLEKERVEAALSAITIRASECSFYHSRTTPFIPMLIDLENGLILRPVSCLTRNPMATLLAIQQFRGDRNTQGMIEPREEWLRSEIYSMFQGARYLRVEGNVKLKKDNQVLTDVDAAILDRTSGDLALFQLKWQDFTTNDVRELRSKASNFVREVDNWSSKVCEWISVSSVMDIVNTFRINPSKHGYARRIFLFVVSRQACRMSGYGFTSTNAFLALATWPQWVRVRTEVGPGLPPFF